MNGLKAKGERLLRILEGTEGSQEKATEVSCREGSVLTLWGSWAVGMLIHHGTMPSEGHRRRGQEASRRLEAQNHRGELRVHKKAADQKGWEPRILGIRGNALA